MFPRRVLATLSALASPAVPLAGLSAVVLSCASASPSPNNEVAFADEGTTVTLPGPPGAPRPEPVGPARPLRGVVTGELTPREQQTYWRLISTLFAPCSNQAVSIAVCIEESRPCAACKPAAELLATRVRAGSTPTDAETAYGIRFGPNLKTLSLAGSPARGPETSPVTVVVFSDFECPACGFAMPEIDRAVDRFGVRLVHKFYPLKQHTHAELAARAAIAAMNQGRYWEMERTLFDHQRALTEPDLLGYARELNLDLRRFKADMQLAATSQLIRRDREEAERLGLSGTPYVLINGREFNTGLFRFDRDLGPWIALELELAKAGSASQPTPQPVAR